MYDARVQITLAVDLEHTMTWDDLPEISIPMVNLSPVVNSLYDLALRKVGGSVCNDTFTIPLITMFEGETVGKADIIVLGYLRIK